MGNKQLFSDKNAATPGDTKKVEGIEFQIWSFSFGVNLEQFVQSFYDLFPTSFLGAQLSLFTFESESSFQDSRLHAHGYVCVCASIYKE